MHRQELVAASPCVHLTVLSPQDSAISFGAKVLAAKMVPLLGTLPDAAVGKQPHFEVMMLNIYSAKKCRRCDPCP
jgi:hypothetical protein